MKKIFVVIFCLISLSSYCQDTIYFNNDPQPSVVKILKIDKEFIYCNTDSYAAIKPMMKDYIYSNSEANKVMLKVPKSMVNKYVLSDSKNIYFYQTFNDTVKLCPEYEYYMKNQKIDSINYKIGYLRYNLGKFHKELFTGLFISSIGLLISTSTPYLIKVPEDYNEYPAYTKKVKAAVFIGAGISLAGTIISLDSYKWIKRASIEPTLYGAKFNYKF